MPTGYTEKIYEGDTSLRNYILRGARMMGFLIHMRDDPLDAPIRKREVNPSYLERMAEASQNLSRYTEMTTFEWEVLHQEKLAEVRDNHTRLKEKNDRIKNTYEEVKKKLEEWSSGSTLLSLKTTLLEHLEESQRFDVFDDLYSKRLHKLETQDLESFKREMVEKALQDLEYHTKAYKEELERANEANMYIDALLAVLPEE